MDKAFLTYATDILGDTDYGLSGGKIAKYMTDFSVQYNISIPYPSYPFPKNIPNKRTALRKNLDQFDSEKQFRIIMFLCNLPQFDKNESVKKLKVRMNSKYHYLGETDFEEMELVSETKHWLEDYPESLKVYKEALIKFKTNTFERNILDDMRLSLEILMKKIISNNKSLENQLDEIGRMLKSNGGSPELRSMLRSLLEYYTSYQNTYIKHNDKVNKSEMIFIIEFTTIMMRHLLKISTLNDFS